MNQIEIAAKFEPLFELLEEEAHKEVDTVILTGGRASSKSFNVALLTLIGLVEKEWQTLYTRFTNISITDSIKLEVSEKIEILNYEPYVTEQINRIESNTNKGFISFKGIKTNSKGQTANLKSLKGFNVFVVDEAEEIPSLETFKKVYYSIRSVNKRNLSILILNPTTKEHWIWQEYFEGKVPEGFCGIKDNVLYVHSSYLDVNPDFIPDNIRKDYERLKLKEPAKYDNIVAGGWIDEPEGAVFRRNELKRYKQSELKKENAEAILAAIDPAAEGTDNTSAPLGYLINNKIYIDDVVFTPEGIDANLAQCSEMLNKHKPEYVRVETNMGNGMYLTLLREKIHDSINLLPVRSTTKKHTRIITMAGFIKEFFVFRDDYEAGSQYDKFMKNLVSYLYSGDSDHDDAPDSLELLATMAKNFYSHLWES